MRENLEYRFERLKAKSPSHLPTISAFFREIWAGGMKEALNHFIIWF